MRLTVEPPKIPRVRIRRITQRREAALAKLTRQRLAAALLNANAPLGVTRRDNRSIAHGL
ncbi:hypothetical protein [Cephaloticoccus primus]|uniref:hypothetical protein n=1 Tax=Cephaloticoccus primus TaxID=1548207 RepID=UPI0012E71DC0|nr:hypothetical protein [Cephaloticoccus primus]